MSTMQPTERPANTQPRSRLAELLASHSWRMRAAIFLLLALYARTIGFAPVYDDNVIGEPLGLRDIPRLFTQDIFAVNGVAHSVYYRPLAVTYSLLVSDFTGATPGFLHLSAILLQVGVFLLAYLLGCRLFGDKRMALLAALLAALHPTKVESVAWIGSSSVDALSAIFFFAALLTFVIWREREKLGWQAASVALFACALLTKETMIAILPLMAVYLWIALPPPRRIRRSFVALIPFATVAAVYLAIRHQVIKPPATDVHYVHPTYSFVNLWNAPSALVWYLRHLLLPWGFSVEYDVPVLTHPSLTGFVLPIVCLLALAFAGWWLWRRQRSPVAIFLACWFVLTLAPAVIFAPMVNEHDRYLYAACYPFAALVAWALLQLNHARTAAILSLVLAFSALSWHEMGFWDSDLTLWQRSLQISPTLIKAEVQSAFFVNQSGDRARALAILDDGLRIHPQSINLWYFHASMAPTKDEQRSEFQKLLQLTDPVVGRPSTEQSARMRSIAAFALAKIELKAGNLAEAERYARTAIQANYAGVGLHSTLGEVLRAEGRPDEAEREGYIELHLRLAEHGR